MGAKHLRLSVKGCGLACVLKVQPDVLHFGIVPTYAWADQLLQLSNNCPQLPMQLAVVASAPYFSSLPAQLELAPCSNGEAVIRYRPKVRHCWESKGCACVLNGRCCPSSFQGSRVPAHLGTSGAKVSALALLAGTAWGTGSLRS